MAQDVSSKIIILCEPRYSSGYKYALSYLSRQCIFIYIRLCTTYRFGCGVSRRYGLTSVNPFEISQQHLHLISKER